VRGEALRGGAGGLVGGRGVGGYVGIGEIAKHVLS